MSKYADLSDDQLLAESRSLVARVICPDCGKRPEPQGEVIRMALRPSCNFRKRQKAVVPVACCKPFGEAYFLDEVVA